METHLTVSGTAAVPAAGEMKRAAAASKIYSLFDAPATRAAASAAAAVKDS